MLRYLLYKCRVLFDRPTTIIFIFLLFIFSLYLCYFIVCFNSVHFCHFVFLIWTGMCVCVCAHARVYLCVCRERKSQIQVSSLEIILNLYSLASLPGHRQEAPDTGRPDCVSPQGNITQLCPLQATPRPNLVGPDHSGDCCGHLACPQQTPLLFV